MIEQIIIKNEKDAWQAMQRALANEISDTAQLSFEGWPVFKLTIQGKDFNGSIPTRVMPPILDLQREIHRIYARARYNNDDTRKLTAEDRAMLELVVEIKPGSTQFITDLVKALNETIKSSNMTGKEAITLFVGIAAIVATTVGWKDWVAAQERMHGQEVSVKMSAEETKRIEIVTQALIAKPELQQNKKFISEFQTDISKQLQPEDKLQIDGVEVINGARASEIVMPPKQEASEIRMDDEFHINEVKFPKISGGKYRFSLTSLSDSKSLLADAAPEKLTADQIQILKDGGFGSKSVFMQINAKELRGRISSAKIVSITWPTEQSKTE